jgi:uncharacterized protein YndB with AHSA1/START domain
MTVDHIDARHGGTWRYSQSDADGAAYAFHGLYHGVPSPDAIVQTYEAEAMPGHVFLCTTPSRIAPVGRCFDRTPSSSRSKTATDTSRPGWKKASSSRWSA